MARDHWTEGVWPRTGCPRRRPPRLPVPALPAPLPASPLAQPPSACAPHPILPRTTWLAAQHTQLGRIGGTGRPCYRHHRRTPCVIHVGETPQRMVTNNAPLHRLTTRVGRWSKQGRAVSGVSNGVKVSAWFKFGKNGADAKSAGASDGTPHQQREPQCARLRSADAAHRRRRARDRHVRALDAGR
jgi:hypothetical protein